MIVHPTMTLRIIRDDKIRYFSPEFCLPDRLQRAWLGEDGTVEWRDVEIIGLRRAQEKESK